MGHLADRGGICGLAGLDSESDLLGDPGGLEMVETIFFGSLEIPSLERDLPGSLVVRCLL